MSSGSKSSVTSTLGNEKIHLISTIVLTISVYILTHQIKLLILSIVFSFFIDLDHIINYLVYLFRFRKNPSLKEFLSGTYHEKTDIFISPLHAWEILFLVILPINKLLALVIIFSVYVHLIIDYFTNNTKLIGYSFIYRAINKFKLESICKHSIVT